METKKRNVEIYTVGCFLCEETIEAVKNIGCASCEITVLDIRDKKNEDRARELGIRAVPALVIDGEISPCCAEGGPNVDTLKKICAVD